MARSTFSTESHAVIVPLPASCCNTSGSAFSNGRPSTCHRGKRVAKGCAWAQRVEGAQSSPQLKGKTEGDWTVLWGMGALSAYRRHTAG